MVSIDSLSRPVMIFALLASQFHVLLHEALVGAFSVIVKSLQGFVTNSTDHLSPGKELVRGVSVPLAEDGAVQVQYSTVQQIQYNTVSTVQHLYTGESEACSRNVSMMESPRKPHWYLCCFSTSVCRSLAGNST